MSDAAETRVPIRLSATGEKEVVAAMQKAAKASSDAWKASLPTPKIVDSFEESAKRASTASTVAAKTITTNWGAIARESQKAAAGMLQVEQTAGKLSYAGLDRGGVQLRSVSDEAGKLSGLVRAMPSIAAQLGFAELGFGVERLRAISMLIRGIKGAGFGAVASAGAPLAGITLGALPVAYDVWAMRETAKLKAETMQGREANNLKVLEQMHKLVEERRVAGQIRGAAGDQITTDIKALIVDQYKAKSSTDPVRNALGSSISGQIPDLFKQISELTRESYATEEKGSLEHLRALAEINETRLNGERTVLQLHLQEALQDRTKSEADQIASAEAFAQRMRGIAEETAQGEKEILDVRQAWIQGALGRVVKDPEETAKFKIELQGIENERVVIATRTEAELERVEAEGQKRIQEIRARTEAQRIADEEKFRREQEKTFEDAERAARQAQRDAERLLQLRQQELQARLTEVGSSYTLTDSQKYSAQSGIIQEGFDTGTLTGMEAGAAQSRLGPDPNNLVAQMQAAFVQIQNEFGTLAQNIAGTFRGVIKTAVDSISDGISGLILGTTTWAQALRNVGTNILTGLVRSIVQMGVQWAATQTMMAIFGKALMAASVASAVPFAVASAGIWAVPAALATIATYGGAAAAAPAAISIANSAVTLSSMAQTLGGFAGFEGGGYTGAGPRNQIAGFAHREEFVMSAPTVERLGLPVLQAIEAGRNSPTGQSAAGSAAGANLTVAVLDSDTRIRRFFEAEGGERLFVDLAQRTRPRWERSA